MKTKIPLGLKVLTVIFLLYGVFLWLIGIFLSGSVMIRLAMFSVLGIALISSSLNMRRRNELARKMGVGLAILGAGYHLALMPHFIKREINLPGVFFLFGFFFLWAGWYLSLKKTREYFTNN
jgi:hypothetical protein